MKPQPTARDRFNLLMKHKPIDIPAPIERYVIESVVKDLNTDTITRKDFLFEINTTLQHSREIQDAFDRELEKHYHNGIEYRFVITKKL